MTEQPTTPEPPRPMPRLGTGVRWGAHLDKPLPPTDPYEPPARTRPTSWPKTGDVGATAQLRADEEPVTVPARPYGKATLIRPVGSADGDVVPFLPTGCLHRHAPLTPPPAAELRAMADDLNAHGGLDEVFVAELLRQAADPLADAKRGLGIVDPPQPPVTTTEPITYETIVEALEKIAPLGPQRLDVVKLTQEQIDAVTASQPHVAPSAEPWHYFGTPVEIVETVEESTPYQLTTQPGGIIEIDTDLTEAEYARLRNDWLHAVEREPQTITRVVPFGEPFRPLADVLDEQPAPALRPWWRRALARVRRWTR